MSRDFIAELDDAVNARCYCGCGSGITAASPSAWFAAEACAARWHGTIGRFELARAELIAKMQKFVGDVIRQFRSLLEALAAAARRLAEVCRLDAVLLPRPAPRPRPPTRIDPGGGISAAPHGRPAFRPARAY